MSIGKGYSVIGKRIRRVDARSKVLGEATLDIQASVEI